VLPVLVNTPMYSIAFLPIPAFSLLSVVTALEAPRLADARYPTPLFQSIFVRDTQSLGALHSGIPLQATMHLSELKDFDAPVPVSGLRHGIRESAGTRSLIRRFVCEGFEPRSLSGASAPAWETV
jgi:transcriptional regulator GlxA family with amidase domain